MIRFMPAVAMVVALAACASPSAPRNSSAPKSPTSASSAASTSAPVAVTLSRGGGLTGSTVRVVITADGVWTRTDRTGARVSGRLTPAQIADLQGLARQLATPSPAPTRGFTCADGFTYAVTAGAVTVGYTDCTKPRPTVAGQIFAAVAGWKVL
jgi:hypothetical protein